MTTAERTDTLIQAEGMLSCALETMALAIGPERAAEVARALIDDKMDRMESRRKVMAGIARREAASCNA